MTENGVGFQSWNPQADISVLSLLSEVKCLKRFILNFQSSLLSKQGSRAIPPTHP
jgi:hypothetical protein